MISKLHVRKRLNTSPSGSAVKPHITGRPSSSTPYPGKENIPPLRLASTTAGTVRTKRITPRRTISRSGSMSDGFTTSYGANTTAT
ncbi:hypothetical protein FRB96_008868 [Tulasnella sp. 330]|nr:hypothetical protein FRB96_008868 [Tulasnella sp. 330]KAG8880591.1 hypothetical protein FRB97_000686 [Tulasnella sp. 331]